MVVSFRNCRPRLVVRLAHTVLMGVMLLAIAMLPAAANDMICLPGNQMEAQHEVAMSADHHPVDCMTSAKQMDDSDQFDHRSMDATEPGGAPDASMHCMPAIGTALTSVEMAAPVLVGTLVESGGWPIEASTLPSRASSTQDRPPQAL